jgi:hypothetical protein
MAERSESTGSDPARRHRVIVWSLIALASLLLVVSLTANWVQRTLFDTDEVVEMTDEILADQDVQEQLSIFAVDQLYANVDVQGELERQLPAPLKALAGPAGAALRQAATDVAENALASPRVQGLVSDAVGGAQSQLVKLLRDEGEYVRTTDGEVTLEYGSVVADLAARLGVDASTITEVQGAIQDFAGDLEGRLTTAESEIKSLRAEVSAAEAGTLDPELRQGIEGLNQKAKELRAKIAGLEDKLEGVEDKVPGPLQDRLSGLLSRLSAVDDRIAAIEQRTGAALEDPSQANLDSLDGALAKLEARVSNALESPPVQTPGELVLMSSSELDSVQSLLAALRNLGFVLPLLVLALYIAAIYLAKDWRPRALAGVGGGIIAAMLLVLLTRRVIGTEVTSLAGSEAVEAAIASVWEIVSGGLRERALFIFVIGLAFIAAGMLAGPGRTGTAARRFLAPHLRESPGVVYAVVAGLFLLWLTFIPGIENGGQILVIILLAALAGGGVAILRRQTAREFPAEK